MYTQYFQLSEEPFSIAANPRFLYLSEQHREALAHLHYGIRMDSGFVMLTGEVGTGKTTVCRCLIEQLPEQANVAFILNPRLTVEELLCSVCDEFDIAYPQTGATVKTLVDAINRYLLEQHAKDRNSVIIIDEAQNLSFEVLEQLRLLTNLETNERKLLRIMLIGQPELETMVGQTELRQLEQRITARYYLKPLARNELQPYIIHRLALAGGRESVFPARLADQIYARSRGIPRLINIICDRAMLGAYARSQRQVDRKIIDEAVCEVQGRKQSNSRGGTGLGVAALIMLTLGAGLFYLHGAGLVALPTFVKSMQDPAMKAPQENAESPGSTLPASVPLPSTQVAMLGSANAGTEIADAPPRWPDDVSAEDNTVLTAQSALFRLWGLPAPEGDEVACDLAIDVGLRCHAGSGNLGALASYDRPAILVLLDSVSRPFPALLRSVDENTATIEFAHGLETVSRADLEKHWRGRYQILWRLPPQGRAIVKPGNRGSVVTWLTESLKAAGIDSIVLTDTYNEEVTEAVRTFQHNHGLRGDGIAGRQTLIQLNTLTDSTVPRLDSQGAS